MAHAQIFLTYGQCSMAHVQIFVTYGQWVAIPCLSIYTLFSQMSPILAYNLPKYLLTLKVFS